MKITYICHSSFLVELQSVSLLFDYFKGDIPETDPEKPLFVFVSHRHEDHFSPEIFQLSGKIRNVTYIISDDIWENRVPADLYGETFFMGPGEEERFPAGGTSVRVCTYRSTDEGVAFLVDADGKRIFHAGDLNYWYWKAEGDDWNNGQKADYEKQLQNIAAEVKKDGHIPDAAFIPVDSRLEEYRYLGADGFMDKVGAVVMFPMHTFDDGETVRLMKEHGSTLKYRGRVLGTGKSNESFEV
jgi:L-ascorbate metabolism protein UlaG (beta-lactamase superfamily)